MMLRNVYAPPERTSYQTNYTPLPSQITTENKESCETFNDLNHISGYNLKINLEHNHGVYRSGEEINGKIEIIKNELLPQGTITSLIVRGYWQSTTLYSQHSTLYNPKNSKSSSKTTTKKGENVVVPVKELRYEYHRGYLSNGGEGTELWQERIDQEGIRREVEGDFPLLGDRERQLSPPPVIELPSASTSSLDSTGSRSFDFKFLIPTTTRSNLANPSAYPPIDRGELINFNRCLPPSFSSQSYINGGVEYIIEALLVVEDPTLTTTIPPSLTTPRTTTENDLPPSFPSTMRDSSNLDSHGLIIPTDLLLVNRITFPFEPLDCHSIEFYKTALPIPSIGRDPRDELGGTPRILTEDYLSKEIVEREGGRSLWDCYFKDYMVKSSIGRDVGVLRSEVSFPISLSLTRYSSSLPLLFAFSYTPLSTKSFLKSSSSNNSSSLHLDKLTIILYERILTRSGSAIRSSMVLKELRKEIYDLNQLISSQGNSSLESTTRDSGVYLTSTTSASGGESDSPQTSANNKSRSSQKGLKLLPSTPTNPLIKSFKLSLDLQSPFPSSSTTTSSTNPKTPPTPAFNSTPLKTCGISFRLPNLEREYFLGITIELIDKKKIVQIARIPLFLKVGDDDEVPPWDDGAGDGNGRVEEVRMGVGVDRVVEGGRTERVVQEEEEDGLPGYV